MSARVSVLHPAYGLLVCQSCAYDAHQSWDLPEPIHFDEAPWCAMKCGSRRANPLYVVGAPSRSRGR